MRGFWGGALAAVFLSSATLGAAAEPDEEEPLAPPALVPLVEPLPPLAYPFPAQRANPYDVWQFYGVDRQGFYRPRVIYSPHGAYYLYNGKPYLFAPMHGRDFMPYIVDSP